MDRRRHKKRQTLKNVEFKETRLEEACRELKETIKRATQEKEIFLKVEDRGEEIVE